MEALGYTFGRTDEYYAHTTITAPGWKRPIRLDSLGYSREVLDERINANWDKGVEFYAVLSQRIQKWRTVCGFVIHFISSQNSISTVGLLLGIGTICSVIMITIVLPSVLYILDKFVLCLSLKKRKK